MTDPGRYRCIHTASAVWRSGATPAQMAEAIEATPDVCAHPDACAHGSCRQVMRQYLRDMVTRAVEAQRVRDLREGTER